MALCRCKMCGGDLTIVDNSPVVECEYCGSRQTISTSESEKAANLFNRANRLRMAGEFDKAASLYENLIVEFPEDAEAYWGLCLCNYGIEYVDDPLTGNKIPTCHRASFQKISQDENFNLAMEYSDVVAQKVYRDEARRIDGIMDDILAISKNEKPYDIFICYKETDEKGNRTIDSVLGQEIYDALTEKGYKVFFARISLEDKLGQQYEPYIFSALSSANIMLSLGTKYEYFHAVWVKNEWSRFLKMMLRDKKKYLIPCYKDIDAYDMPDEFKGFQAQDMGKLGFIQDLVRGIQKICLAEDTQNQISEQTSTNTMPLLKRIVMFLEDGEFEKADEFCENVLNQDPENPQVYLYKFMALYKISTEDKLYSSLYISMDDKLIQKAYRFADDDMKNKLDEMIRASSELVKSTRYESLKKEYQEIHTIEDYFRLRNEFIDYGDYKEASDYADQIWNVDLKKFFDDAVETYENAEKYIDYVQTQEIFIKLGDYPEAQKYVSLCDRYVAGWRPELEKLAAEAEQFSNAKEIYEAVKEIGALMANEKHKEFVEKLARTVEVEKFYGNKKARAINEVEDYLKNA